jgi:CheY-like chemotaxis protein
MHARDPRTRFEIRETGFDVPLLEGERMHRGMTRARVVLVENDPDSLEVFSILLGEKYAVCGYASAVEALQAIEAAKPDVLVLDIGMHPIDGMQCLEAIRATPGYSDIPAVALTGFARDVERQSFLDGGFQAVVVKPMLDSGELMAAIDRLVNSRGPAGRSTPLYPRRSSAMPAPSAAAADLDGRTAMTASGAGESGKTRGQAPA